MSKNPWKSVYSALLEAAAFDALSVDLLARSAAHCASKAAGGGGTETVRNSSGCMAAMASGVIGCMSGSDSHKVSSPSNGQWRPLNSTIATERASHEQRNGHSAATTESNEGFTEETGRTRRNDSRGSCAESGCCAIASEHGFNPGGAVAITSADSESRREVEVAISSKARTSLRKARSSDARLMGNWRTICEGVSAGGMSGGFHLQEAGEWPDGDGGAALDVASEANRDHVERFGIIAVVVALGRFGAVGAGKVSGALEDSALDRRNHLQVGRIGAKLPT